MSSISWIKQTWGSTSAEGTHQPCYTSNRSWHRFHSYQGSFQNWWQSNIRSPLFEVCLLLQCIFQIMTNLQPECKRVKKVSGLITLSTGSMQAPRETLLDAAGDTNKASTATRADSRPLSIFLLLTRRKQEQEDLTEEDQATRRKGKCEQATLAWKVFSQQDPATRTCLLQPGRPFEN